MKTIGSRVEYLINQANIKKVVLARALGVTPLTVSRIITDKGKTGYNLLVKIAEYFGCSLDWLIAGKDWDAKEGGKRAEKKYVIIELKEDTIEFLQGREYLSEVQKQDLIDLLKK